MKKEIIAQLLNDKENMLNDEYSDQIEAYELKNNQIDEFIYKYNSGKKTSRKLEYSDQVIFLIIYKAFSKRRRCINQFDRANELKLLFKEGVRKDKFKYIYYGASKLNPKTNQYELIKFTQKDFRLALIYGKTFLAQIGLSERLLVKIYGYRYDNPINMLSCLEDIANYIIHSTPAAIVQMNKRLRKKHSY